MNKGRLLGIIICLISAAMVVVLIGAICGLAFADTCAAKYPAGEKVVLKATACPGSYFVRWDGACAGQGAECTLIMDGDKQTSAVFEPLPIPYNFRFTEWEKQMCIGGGYTQRM